MIRKLIAAATLAAFASTALGGTAHAGARGVIGCRDAAHPIGYRLNVAAVTNPESVMAIRVAVAMVQARTGNTYRYDGLTTEIPTVATVPTQSDDLIIAVVDQLNPLAGTINGMAGTNLFFYAEVENGMPTIPAAFTYTTAPNDFTHVAIMFDAANFNTRPSGLDFATHVSNFVIAEHELGHSVGLDHSTNVTDVMSGAKPTTSIFYSPNDSALLSAAGCGDSL